MKRKGTLGREKIKILGKRKDGSEIQLTQLFHEGGNC